MMQVFEVSFEVFVEADKSDWRYRTGKKYVGVIVVAKNLNQLFTDGTAGLLKKYPYDYGTAGSHYSTDPVYGNRLEFTDIRKLHNVDFVVG